MRSAIQRAHRFRYANSTQSHSSSVSQPQRNNKTSLSLWSFRSHPMHSRKKIYCAKNFKPLLNPIVLSSLRFLSMFEHPENVIKCFKSDWCSDKTSSTSNNIVVSLLRPRFTCTRPDKQLFVTPIKHQPRQLVTLLHFPSRSPYLVNCNKVNCENCRTIGE